MNRFSLLAIATLALVSCKSPMPSCPDVPCYVHDAGKYMPVDGCLVCTNDTTCHDPNECTLDKCVDGMCLHEPLPDGAICLTGKCQGGKCVPEPGAPPPPH